MGEYIKRMIEGMGQVLVVSPSRVYEKPLKSDFRSDLATLRNDARKVGQDLTNTTKQYSDGKPSYQR